MPLFTVIQLVQVVDSQQGSSPQSPVPGREGRDATSALLVQDGDGQQGFVPQSLQYQVGRKKGMGSFVVFASSRVAVTILQSYPPHGHLLDRMGFFFFFNID